MKKLFGLLILLLSFISFGYCGNITKSFTVSGNTVVSPNRNGTTIYRSFNLGYLQNVDFSVSPVSVSFYGISFNGESIDGFGTENQNSDTTWIESVGYNRIIFSNGLYTNPANVLLNSFDFTIDGDFDNLYTFVIRLGNDGNTIDCSLGCPYSFSFSITYNDNYVYSNFLGSQSSSCESDLSSCQSDLNGCEYALQNTESNLSYYYSGYNSCVSSLNSCESDYLSCSSSLGNCGSSLNSCQNALGNCMQGNIGTGENRSAIYINDIQHLGKPIINITIPDEISWDYISTGQIFDLNVSGYVVDTEYIEGVIAVNSYQPTSEDFTNIFVSGLTLVFPYIVIVLFIVFVRKLIKKIFK